MNTNAFNLRNVALAAIVTTCSTSINVNAENVSNTLLNRINQVELGDWDTGYQIKQEEKLVFPPRKDLKNRYRRITKADWFQKAYHDMSVGDVISIE